MHVRESEKGREKERECEAGITTMADNKEIAKRKILGTDR